MTGRDEWMVTYFPYGAGGASSKPMKRSPAAADEWLYDTWRYPDEGYAWRGEAGR